MELDANQKELIVQWAGEGSSLSELQKRINDEFKLSLTFMDVRLMMLDLDVKIKDRKAASVNIDLSKAPPTAPDEDGPGAPQEQVTIEIEKLKKPGALVNGTVTFSDGVTASWMLDRTGRLGLSGVPPEYKPSESDLADFQEKLSRLLQSRGF